MYRKAWNRFFGFIDCSTYDPHDNTLIMLFYLMFDTVKCPSNKLPTVTKYSTRQPCILALVRQ
jgi:hypothetical protein